MAGAAIMMPNWIGDFMLALSVIDRMKSASKPLVLLTSPELAPLAQACASLDIVSCGRTNSAQRRAAISDIRARSFEKAYLLPYSFTSAWLAFRAGIPERRGIAKDGRGFLLTERLKPSTRDYARHITREYSAVLETDYREPETWPGKRIAVDEKYRGAVVVCPGATYGPAKRWPYFNGLLRMLDKERVVLLGKKGDSDGLMTAGTGEALVTDLTGVTTLAQAVAIIAAAKIVVANDSGPMHIAGFAGTPVIGVFGSTSPDWTRPLGAGSRIAYNRQPCSPCFKRTCRFGHYQCLAGITAEDVMRLVHESNG